MKKLITILLLFCSVVVFGQINTSNNKTHWDAAGRMRCDSLVWDDLRAPANGINPAGTPSPAGINTADGSLTFGQNTSQVAVAWFQLPHNWKEGTNIIIHIHWSKSTSAAGTVDWQMKYKWANWGDVMGAFSNLATGVEMIPNSNTADKHALYAWDTISGVGKTLSSMICVYLTRVNGDSYATLVNLYEIDIHYQIDKLGSTLETRNQ